MSLYTLSGKFFLPPCVNFHPLYVSLIIISLGKPFFKIRINYFVPCSSLLITLIMMDKILHIFVIIQLIAVSSSIA